MGGCGTGPCERSTSRGGPGCYLCDVVSALPQPEPWGARRTPARSATRETPTAPKPSLPLRSPRAKRA